MLTTLTAAVVLPTAGGNRFQFCVCNVGDSLAYVYSKVQEREIKKKREKRERERKIYLQP